MGPMEKLMLQKYVHQLRPRNESYTPHVDKVQNLFTEAYSFFPTSEEEISKTLADWPHERLLMLSTCSIT